MNYWGFSTAETTRIRLSQHQNLNKSRCPNDVEIVDVLLAIAWRISQTLERREIQLQPTGLKKLLQETGKVLQAEVTGIKIKPPKLPGVELGEIGASAKQDEFSVNFAIGELTAKMKDDTTLRRQMNQYLGPQKTSLHAEINRDLLKPAIAQLKQQGYKGLAVIVDNLDRISDSIKNNGKSQHESLFVDQARFLKLNCHLVYTIPLAMLFSSAYGNLTQRFQTHPISLPMVSIKDRNGCPDETGMEREQVTLARTKILLTKRHEKGAMKENMGEMTDDPGTKRTIAISS